MNHLNTIISKDYNSQQGKDYNLIISITSIPARKQDTFYPELDIFDVNFWLKQYVNGTEERTPPKAYKVYFAYMQRNWEYGDIKNQQFHSYPDTRFSRWLRDIVLSEYDNAPKSLKRLEEFLEDN